MSRRISVALAQVAAPGARLLNPFPMVNMGGISTAFIGWLLLGEGLQPYHWAGATLIFAGLLLATRPGKA